MKQNENIMKPPKGDQMISNGVALCGTGFYGHPMISHGPWVGLELDSNWIELAHGFSWVSVIEMSLKNHWGLAAQRASTGQSPLQCCWRACLSRVAGQSNCGVPLWGNALSGIHIRSVAWIWFGFAWPPIINDYHRFVFGVFHVYFGVIFEYFWLFFGLFLDILKYFEDVGRLIMAHHDIIIIISWFTMACIGTSW